MAAITVKELLAGAGDWLAIRHLTGKRGLTRRVRDTALQRLASGKASQSSSLSPNLILIMTPADFSASHSHGPEGPPFPPSHVLKASMPCLALSQSERLPESIIQFSEGNGIPCFASVFDEPLLTSRLSGLLQEKINGASTVHGSLVHVRGCGVLIIGQSGTGKTRLALALTARGHAWVADDIVCVEKKPGGILCGRGHERIRRLLELKGKGIMPVDQMSEIKVVFEETTIDMVVVLDGDRQCLSATETKTEFHDIMGIKLPVIRFTHSLCRGHMAEQIELSATLARKT